MEKMFGKRILILIPHPDDEAVGCCAGILRAVAKGSKVFGFYLTTGVYPREKEWPWLKFCHHKKALRRKEEAKEVAKRLSLEPASFQEIPSRCLKNHFDRTQKLVGETVRHLAIDTLWTPAYEGGHPDHDVANFLASTFSASLKVWEFSEYHFYQAKPRNNIFFEPRGEEITLTLTPEEQTSKKQALALYRSEQFNFKVIQTHLLHETFRPLAFYDYTKSPYEGKMYYQRFQRFSFHPKVDTTHPEELCRLFRHYMT